MTETVHTPEEISSNEIPHQNADEKCNLILRLAKSAAKSLRIALTLDETQKQLRKEFVEAGDQVNILSRCIAENSQYSHDDYATSLNHLAKCNRKLHKFLDNYEDVRDNSLSELKALRNHVDNLISEAESRF